jgi:hypothetical protein
MDCRYEAGGLAASPTVPSASRPHQTEAFYVGNGFKAELVDVFIDGTTIQVWSKNHPIKTVARLRKGPVRREAPPA